MAKNRGKIKNRISGIANTRGKEKALLSAKDYKQAEVAVTKDESSKLSKTFKSFFKPRIKNKTKGKKGVKLDALSWFFITIATGVVLSLLYIALQFGAKSEQQIVGYEHYNKDLNFYLTIPYEWQTVKLDADLIDKAVKKATGGVTFDMSLFSLKDEIVPLTLLVTVPEDDDRPFSKFMTFAFNGSDQNFSRLADTDSLKKDFKVLLESLDHKNVKVESVENISTDSIFGVLLKGNATLEGTKIQYYQYHEPAGANILTLTYGSTEKTKEKKVITEIANLLSSLTYFSGGASLGNTSTQDVERIDPLGDILEGTNGKNTEDSKSDDVEVKVDETQSEGDIEIKVENKK